MVGKHPSHPSSVMQNFLFALTVLEMGNHCQSNEHRSRALLRKPGLAVSQELPLN